MKPNRRSWTTHWIDWAVVSGLLALVLLFSMYAWHNRETAVVQPAPFHAAPPSLDQASSSNHSAGSAADLTTNTLSWHLTDPTATPTATSRIYLAPPTVTPTPAPLVLAIVALSNDVRSSCGMGYPPVILRQATEGVVGTPVCGATTAGVGVDPLV